MELKVGDRVKVKSKESLCSIDDEYRFSDVFMGLIAGKEMYVKAVSAKTYDFATLDSKQGFGVPKEFVELYVTKLDESKTKTSAISETLVKDLANIITKYNLSVKIEEKDGGIFVKPIEKEEDDLAVDTPVMVSDDLGDWVLRYYAGCQRVYLDRKRKCSNPGADEWEYIIPCDKFNFENPEESIQYNIVK